MIRIKRSHNNIILSRKGTEAKIKIPYEGEEQRKRVEGNIIEFFNVDSEIITIISETGNLVRRIIT